METTLTTEGLPEEVNGGKPKLNLWQRLVGVVVSPGQTMEDIVKHPSYWGVMLVLLVVSLLQAILLLPALEVFLESQLSMQSLPLGQDLESVKAITMTTAKIGTIVTATLGLVIGWAIVALVLWVLAKFLGEASYGQLFSLTVFSSVPLVIIGGTITTILIMATGGENMDKAGISLAVLLPGGFQNLFVATLLSKFDVFTIWTLGLLGIGGAKAMGASTKQALIPLTALWLLWVVASSSLILFKVGP